MKIKIMTDPTSCLPLKFAEKENITFFETLFDIDGKMYKELSDINKEEFVESLSYINPYPKSSLASPPAALEIYEQAIKEGYDEIFYIAVSPNITNMIASAKMASKKVHEKIKVTIYPTGLMGPSQGAMIYSAIKLFKKGKTVEEIIQYLDSIKDLVHSAGLSADFNTLFRTGRIKKGIKISVISSVMRLKPLFEINLDQGVVGIGGGLGYRGAIKKIIKNLQGKAQEGLTYDLFLLDSMAPKLSEKLKKEIPKVIPIKDIHYWDLPSMIIWAIGKGAVIATISPILND